MKTKHTFRATGTAAGLVPFALVGIIGISQLAAILRCGNHYNRQ